NGAFYEIPEAPKLDKKYKHDIDVVVDRIVLPKAGDEKARKDVATRLADSFETALELADGIAIAEFADKPLASPSPRSSRGEGQARTREGQKQTPSPEAAPHPSALPAGGDREHK